MYILCTFTIIHDYTYKSIVYSRLSVQAHKNVAHATYKRTPSSVSVLICPAWPVWYRVQTGAACPASGLRSALVLARPGISGTACAAACAAQPFRVRWSGQGCTGGAYSRRPSPPGQSFNHRKNKKGSKNHPCPLFQISKIPRKNKKTPTKGLCSVLYLPYKP